MIRDKGNDCSVTGSSAEDRQRDVWFSFKKIAKKLGKWAERRVAESKMSIYTNEEHTTI